VCSGDWTESNLVTVTVSPLLANMSSTLASLTSSIAVAVALGDPSSILSTVNSYARYVLAPRNIL